jgi:hypothetical protein
LSDPLHITGQAGPIPAAAGIGLRFPHHQQVLHTRPDVPWFEVHAENYFGGGAARRTLEAVRRDYPWAAPRGSTPCTCSGWRN